MNDFEGFEEDDTDIEEFQVAVGLHMFPYTGMGLTSGTVYDIEVISFLMSDETVHRFSMTREFTYMVRDEFIKYCDLLDSYDTK